MCYGYEDFCELEEIQELTDEYLKKAKDIFNERVKNHIEEYNAREKVLNNREADLRKRESALKEAKERFEKDQNIKIYQMMRQFGFDLKPRQRVYFIDRDSKDTKCPHCEKGKITKVIDGLVFKTDCPHCKGFGSITHYSYKVISGEVSSVYFKLRWLMEEQKIEHDDMTIKWDGEWDESTVFLDNLSPRTNKSCIHLSREDIYLTQEEAEKAIEEKKAKDAKR